MVACEVGEYATNEGQAAYTLLCNGVRRAFHEGVLATCIDHTLKQFVELDRVGCGMVGRYSLVNDVVAHGRQESALVSHLGEHII